MTRSQIKVVKNTYIFVFTYDHSNRTWVHRVAAYKSRRHFFKSYFTTNKLTAITLDIPRHLLML